MTVSDTFVPAASTTDPFLRSCTATRARVIAGETFFRAREVGGAGNRISVQIISYPDTAEAVCVVTNYVPLEKEFITTPGSGLVFDTNLRFDEQIVISHLTTSPRAAINSISFKIAPAVAPTTDLGPVTLSQLITLPGKATVKLLPPRTGYAPGDTITITPRKRVYRLVAKTVTYLDPATSTMITTTGWDVDNLRAQVNAQDQWVEMPGRSGDLLIIHDVNDSGVDPRVLLPFAETFLRGGGGLPPTPIHENTGPVTAIIHVNYCETGVGALYNINDIYEWKGPSNATGYWLKRPPIPTIRAVDSTTPPDIFTMIDANFTINVVGSLATFTFALTPVPLGTVFIVDIVRRGEDFDRDPEVLGATRASTLVVPLYRSGIFDVRLQITNPVTNAIVATLVQESGIKLASLLISAPNIVHSIFSAPDGFRKKNITGIFPGYVTDNADGASTTTLRKESLNGAVQAVPTLTPYLFQVQVLNFDTGIWENKGMTSEALFNADPFSFLNTSRFVLSSVASAFELGATSQQYIVATSNVVLCTPATIVTPTSVAVTSGAMPSGATLQSRHINAGILMSSNRNVQVSLVLDVPFGTSPGSYTFTALVNDSDGKSAFAHCVVQLQSATVTVTPSTLTATSFAGYTTSGAQAISTTDITVHNTTGSSLAVYPGSGNAWYDVAIPTEYTTSDNTAPVLAIDGWVGDVPGAPFTYKILTAGASAVYTLSLTRPNGQSYPSDFLMNETITISNISGSLPVPSTARQAQLPISVTLEPQAAGISGYPSTVARGDVVNFTVTTTNVPDGVTLAWDIVQASVPGSSLNLSMFDLPYSGDITIVGNTATVMLTMSSAPLPPTPMFRLHLEISGGVYTTDITVT